MPGGRGGKGRRRKIVRKEEKEGRRGHNERKESGDRRGGERR